MRPGIFYVYILENPQGRFYVGQTDGLDQRLADHNDPEWDNSRYTAKNGPWTLVWHEEHPTRAEAMRREKFIKSREFSTWIRKYLRTR